MDRALAAADGPAQRGGGGRGWTAGSTGAAGAGGHLLRTDRKGWIELSTDGEQLWVEVERK